MQNKQAIPFNKENFEQIFSFKFLSVIAISVPSALFADYFNLPLAWFLGPMVATSIGALMGLKVKMPRLVLSSILILLGLYIGNYIDKDLFSQMHEWAFTSFIMFVYIVLSIFIVSLYLQKFSNYEKKTSIFSAAPGALGPLMILAEDQKTDLSHVATSHLIRLIIIVTVFPFFVNSYYDVGSIEVVNQTISDQNKYHLLALIIFSIFLIFPSSTLNISTKSVSVVSDNTFFVRVNDIFNLSAPGAAKFVNPFALSYKDESSFALTNVSDTLNPTL